MKELVDYVANIGINGSDINGLEHRLDKLGWQYTDAQKREEYPRLLRHLIDKVQERYDGYDKIAKERICAASIGMVPFMAEFALAIYTHGESIRVQREVLGQLGGYIMLGITTFSAYMLLRGTLAYMTQGTMTRVRKNLERRLAILQ